MDYKKRLKKLDYDKNYYHTIYKYKRKNYVKYFNITYGKFIILF